MQNKYKVGDMVKLLTTGQVGTISSFFDDEVAMVEVDGQKQPTFLKMIKPITDEENPFKKSFEADDKGLRMVSPLENIAELDQQQNAPKELKPAAIPTPTPTQPADTIDDALPPINTAKAKQHKPAPAENKQTPLNPPKQVDLSKLDPNNNNGDGQPDKGIILALVPHYDDDKDINYFDLVLVNRTGIALDVSCKFYLLGHLELQNHNSIAPRGVLNITEMDFDEINDQPQLIFNIKRLGAKKTQFMKDIKPKAKILRKNPQPLIELQHHPAYTMELCHKLPPIPVIVGSQKPKPRKELNISNLKEQYVKVWNAEQKTGIRPKIEIQSEDRIIDLHIEKLTDKYKTMSSKQILDLQLKKFAQRLDRAIQQEESNLIVIHGIGKGRLRDEIINLVRNYPAVKTFRNEYNPNYGFGATEIIFDHAWAKTHKR